MLGAVHSRCCCCCCWQVRGAAPAAPLLLPPGCAAEHGLAPRPRFPLHNCPPRLPRLPACCAAAAAMLPSPWNTRWLATLEPWTLFASSSRIHTSRPATSEAPPGIGLLRRRLRVPLRLPLSPQGGCGAFVQTAPSMRGRALLPALPPLRHAAVPAQPASRCRPHPCPTLLSPLLNLPGSGARSRSTWWRRWDG